MTGTREPAPRSFTSTPEATKESSVQTTLLTLESLQFDRFQREAAACRRRSVLSARRKRSAAAEPESGPTAQPACRVVVPRSA